jgi:cytochrome P450
MAVSTAPAAGTSKPERVLSLYHLLDPEVLANPYPLYRRLREEDPVRWDPFLHAWVVTRYNDVVHVLHHFSANRTPAPEQLSAMGLSALNPIAKVMVRQMLFLDPPDHTRLRALASAAFTPRRVERLRSHIQEIMDGLLDRVISAGRMDVIADFASPAPAIVTAEMFGIPVSDHGQLKDWSADFAEMLGNFQHNPDRFPRVLRSLDNMCSYFRAAMQQQRNEPRDGLIQAMMAAEVDGNRLTEEEIVANLIVTMVGGQETTTNLIGNGLLTLLRNPAEMERLRIPRSFLPPWKSFCVTRARASTPPGLLPMTLNSAESRFVSARQLLRSWAQVIAIPSVFPILIGWILPVKITVTLPLAGRLISVLAPRWRALKAKSPSPPSCAGSLN